MFIRSIFPDRTGLSCSGGIGAEAQWLFHAGTSHPQNRS